MEAWLSLRILDLWYVGVLYILQPLQRLAIHLVAKTINNRLNLLTPKVQTLLKTIPQNYCKLLLQMNSNLNYLLSVKTHNSMQ